MEFPQLSRLAFFLRLGLAAASGGGLTGVEADGLLRLAVGAQFIRTGRKIIRLEKEGENISIGGAAERAGMISGMALLI